MMTYVDTSMLLKLVIEEAGSGRAEMIWGEADALAAAKIGYVEARAAAASARRSGRVTAAQHRDAVEGIDLLWRQLSVIEITDQVIERAAELADEHGLRGYDAVHLAAAIEIGAIVFTSADRRLCEAARAVGFYVSNPTDPEMEFADPSEASEALGAAVHAAEIPGSNPQLRMPSGTFDVVLPASAVPIEGRDGTFRVKGVGTIQEVTSLYKDQMSTDGWIFDADYSVLDPYQAEDGPHAGYITWSIYAKPTSPVVTVAIIVGNFDRKPGRKRDLTVSIVQTPDDELPARALRLVPDRARP